jgi:hypothetical protein
VRVFDVMHDVLTNRSEPVERDGEQSVHNNH